MKKKCSTRSTKARHNQLIHNSAIAGQRRFGQGGFVNLRALLALLIGFSGVALAIFSARDLAVRPAPEPERYMPVPSAKGQAKLLAWNGWNSTGMTV